MINNKIGGRNMVGRAVNRLAGRLTAVALTAAMAVSMLAGCAAGGKNTETAAKKEYKPSAMEQMNAKNDPNVIQDNYRTCYEVFVYSFFDSDGDGIGDLKGLTPPLPVSGGGRQLDISFRPLLSEALHFSTAAPNVTGHGWLYPTGYPVYAPARSPVEGI